MTLLTLMTAQGGRATACRQWCVSLRRWYGKTSHEEQVKVTWLSLCRLRCGGGHSVPDSWADDTRGVGEKKMDVMKLAS